MKARWGGWAVGRWGVLKGLRFFHRPIAPSPHHPSAAALLVAALSACAEPPPPAALEPPQLLTDSIPFAYPMDLWDHHVSGRTVLLLRVNQLGQVDSALVDTTSGYPEFDSAAMQGAPRLRFISGRQGERHVTMWTRLPVRFGRDSANQMGIGGP